MNLGINTDNHFIFFVSVSCKRSDDAWNEIRITNATKDTVSINFKREGGTLSGYTHKIQPCGNFIFSRAIYTSDYRTIIRNNWGRDGDTMTFVINDTIIRKWGAPLCNLPDSIHGFYNENSWDITYGGYKGKFIRATFTVTEEDFK